MTYVPKKEFVPPKKNKPLKVAVAHLKLARSVLDPVTYVKMGVHVASHRGLTIPGSRYIGPFNPVTSRITLKSHEPKSYGDQLARKHDLAYDKYLKEDHIKPYKVYLGYSEADEELRKASSKDKTHVHSLTTRYGMEVKRLAHKMHLTPSVHVRKL